MKRKKVYFVSYIFSDQSGLTGVGNGFTEPIDKIDCNLLQQVTMQLQDKLCKNMNNNNIRVGIMSFHELR